MGGRPIRSVNTPSSGERRVLTGPAPAASSQTLTPIGDADLLEVWENAGVRHGIRGDGRIVLPLLPGPPATPVENDFWLQDDGSGGVEICYYDGTTTLVIGGVGAVGDPGIRFSLIPDVTSIARGSAMRATATGCDRASAGAGAVAGGLYDVVGLLSVAVPPYPNPPVDPVRLVLPGQPITLLPSEITFLTGESELVVSRRYFLSSTEGRWVLEPGLSSPYEVVVSVGYALSPTTLMVQPGTAVVL